MRPIFLAHLALSLALLAALPAAGATRQVFEGVIVSSVHDEDDNKTMELTISQKGTKVRLESPDMEGTYSVVDVLTRVFTMVTPREKKYMKFELGDVGDDETAKVSFKPTGKTETVAGYSCTHYLWEDEGETFDICAANGLGFLPTMGGQMGSSGQGASLPRDFLKTFKDGFQPLKMELVSGGKRELVLLVKSVTRKAMPASLFEIPAGFQEVKMGLPQD